MDFDSDFLGKEMGADTEADDEHTPAHSGAANGDTQLVIRAMKQDPSVIQQKDSDGYTPLAHAVLGKHFQTMKRLIKVGADINVQDSQGRTCLAVAAYQGWSDGVVYLLRKGARQDVVDKSGRTPLHASTYDTDPRSLISLMKRLTPSELNIGDNERMTALHWAAFHNRPDHVRQLLQKGAKPILHDIDGKTALHWAAQNGSELCCRIFYEFCWHLIPCIDNCGKTALHLAAAAGHTAILQDLARAAPASCETLDKDDRTPLHWAAATGHSSCVGMLLNVGVTPNPVDVDGVTPLEYATNAGHKDCIVLLRDRLGIKSDSSKKKQGEHKNTSSGFFKGLFSRKKDHDKRKGETQSHTKLPDVSTSKNGLSDSRNSFRSNNTLTGLGGSVNMHIDNSNNNSRDITSLSPREQAVQNDNLLSGNSEWRKKRHNEKEGRDAGVLTPSTRNSVSTWTDNSSYQSAATELRTSHLSPLSALRPTLLSPRIAQSPSLGSFDPLLKRRQGELTPIRIDRMKAERLEIPAPESTRSRDDGRPTSLHTPHFTMNGKFVLPDIHTDTWEKDIDQSNDRLNSDHRPSGKKKKHKKKRHENDLIDQKIYSASPCEEDADIYRPLDRGRRHVKPMNGYTEEIERIMDGKVSNNETYEVKDVMCKEGELITALTGMQIQN